MNGSSIDDDNKQSLMGQQGMLLYKASLLVDDASLIDVCSTYFLGEFGKLRINLKEINNEGNVPRKSHEESQM